MTGSDLAKEAVQISRDCKRNVFPAPDLAKRDNGGGGRLWIVTGIASLRIDDILSSNRLTTSTLTIPATGAPNPAALLSAPAMATGQEGHPAECRTDMAQDLEREWLEQYCE